MPRCTEEETAKQLGCPTTGRRIAITNPPHASTGLARVLCFVVIVVVGLYVQLRAHQLSCLDVCRRMESVTQPALDELGGNVDIILSLRGDYGGVMRRIP